MIWVDEIGDAFLNTTITAVRLDGSTFEVSPQWESPEGETGEDAFSPTPKIFFAFENLGLNLQNQKEQRLIKVVKDDNNDGEWETVDMQETPIPYVLYFRVELVTYWQEDDVALLTAWMRKFPARGYIDVVDPADGETYRLFMEMTEHVPIPEDQRDATKGRMFRQFFRYAIWTQLDSSQPRTYKLVKERIVIAREKE